MTPGSISSMPQAKIKASAFLFSFVVILSIVLAACGGGTSPQQSSSSGQQRPLILGVQNNPITRAGFNIFSSLSGTGIEDIAGFVNEPLYFVNLNDGSYTPLLATSYQWNSNFTQLTFSIRQGVKWNDGQPFSASDVAFTFNELKQYPATDLNGDWNYLSSVVAPNDTTVVMTFKKPYVPALYLIAGQTYIIPQHVFANVGDPTKYVSDKPVGTGPFVIGKYNSDIVVFDKNPNYWQADKVKVNEIRMPFIKDNQSAELELAKGDLDWAGFFSPDLQTNFVGKDPAHNHYWMAPIDEFGLFPNMTNPLLANVAVRQAINAALDRQALDQQAESGLAPPINATALVLPGAQPYLNPAYANLSNNPDVQKAQKYLTDAGFVKGPDGIFMDKSGHRLSFTLRSVIGYTDWNQMAQIMQQDLKAAGIEISKINQVDPNQYYGIRGDNNFDLEIGGLAAGPTPFNIYYAGLYSKFIGSNAGNYERWNNPQTDQLLNQYAQTGDPATQKQIIMKIEDIFVQQLPWIPLVTGPRWFEYSTLHYTGWPTQDNAYATGSPYSAPDNEIVVMHLTPVS